MRLEELLLGCNNIADADVKDISDELATNTSLYLLDLHDNLIKIEGK